MKENGKMAKEMELVYYVGIVKQNILDILQIIMLQDMGNYGMKREIHIKGNGKIIKQKDGVYIIQKKEYFLGENGLPTNKTVSGSKDGREEVFFLGSIIMEIKMVLVY